MTPFINYIETTNADANLLEIYREFREYFQMLGWSEKDLENPPYYTAEMMELNNQFQVAQDKLRKEIKSFFGDSYTAEELNNYILGKLEKINEETPLSKKGYNRKNEDLWQ